MDCDSAPEPVDIPVDNPPSESTDALPTRPVGNSRGNSRPPFDPINRKHPTNIKRMEIENLIADFMRNPERVPTDEEVKLLTPALKHWVLKPLTDPKKHCRKFATKFKKINADRREVISRRRDIKVILPRQQNRFQGEIQHNPTLARKAETAEKMKKGEYGYVKPLPKPDTPPRYSNLTFYPRSGGGWDHLPFTPKLQPIRRKKKVDSATQTETVDIPDLRPPISCPENIRPVPQPDPPSSPPKSPMVAPITEEPPHHEFEGIGDYPVELGVSVSKGSEVKEQKRHHPPEVNKIKKTALGAVYEYLMLQNRPYSNNHIVFNLGKEYDEGAVQKALLKLVQDERVREKTYGKQKVFWVNQDWIPEASPEELKKMDQEIEVKKQRIKELETSCKEAQNELKELTISSTMTTEEAKALVEKLTKENLELDTKYKALSANNTVVLDKNEREQIRKKRMNAIAEWRKRRRMCLEMLNPILKDWSGTKEILYEEISIKTDEDAWVNIPTD